MTRQFISVVDPYLAVDTEFQKSIHLSTSLAGMILLLILQYHIREHGYKLSRSFFDSTDNLAFISMGIVSGVWLMLIFLSAYIWEDDSLNPCREEPGGYKCLGRLAFVPWILIGVFLWWAAYYVAHRLTRILRHHLFQTEASARVWEPWNSRAEPFLAFVIIAGPLGWIISGAFYSQLYILGMLSMAALVILAHALVDSDSHFGYEHRYAMDDIRVPLSTPVERGIVYVLPSRDYGFDAVYSPRLDSEQTILEENRQWFEPMDIVKEKWTLGKCKTATRKIVMSRILKLGVDGKHIKDLGRWLYWNRRRNAEQPDQVKIFPLIGMRCKGHHLSPTIIGRDVVMALLQWEYTVFEHRWELDDKTSSQVWRLREAKYSGAGVADKESWEMAEEPKGAKSGIDGFLDAVGEVYRILDPEPKVEYHLTWIEWLLYVTLGGSGARMILAQATLGQAVPRQQRYMDPIEKGKKEATEVLKSLEGRKDKLFKKSVIEDFKPSKEWDSIEEYAGDLWTKCWEECPSTFEALYLWTTVWYIDVGNVGFHSTPLIPSCETTGRIRHGPDYMTAWRMKWRHTWHEAIICQLVMMLPTIITSFFALVGFA